MGSRLKVNLKIDDLVLYGVDKASAVQVGKVIESELIRLIRNDGLPNGLYHQNREVSALDGSMLGLSKGLTDPSLLGIRIARSVYNSFGDLK